MSRKKQQINPLKLFLQGQQERVESAPDDMLEQEALQDLSFRNKRFSSRHQKCLAKINKVDFTVHVLPYEELFEKAVAHYNDLQLKRESEGLKTSGFRAHNFSNTGFLHRVMLNFVLHELTDYEEILPKLNGKSRSRDGYVQVRFRYIDRIAEVYPFLVNECKSQRRKTLRRKYGKSAKNG